MLHRTSARKSVNPKLNKIHSKHVIDTHDDFITMPFTACIQGARGSGKTVACELAGDVGNAIALAAIPFRFTELRPCADGVEDAHGAIGDAPGQLA